MDDPLSTYLDRLIYSMYGSAQRGYGYVRKDPLHSEVIEYIEDESTGRPCPIDDSADHYLLRTFDRARRELLLLTVDYNECRGMVISPSSVYEVISETVCGEIPWRLKHTETCPICKLQTDTPTIFCSVAHIDIRSRMNVSGNEPGVVSDGSRPIPLREGDTDEASTEADR